MSPGELLHGLNRPTMNALADADATDAGLFLRDDDDSSICALKLAFEETLLPACGSWCPLCNS